MMDYGGYWGPGNGAVGWLLMCLTFAILLGVVESHARPDRGGTVVTHP